MAYCTTYDIKLYGGYSDSDNFDDDLFAMLIPIAQQKIDSYCKRTFEYTNDSDSSESRIFDAEDSVVDGYTLILDKDLHSIRSITVDGTAISSDNYVTEPRSDAPYWGVTILGSSESSWDYGTDAENAIAVDGHWAFSQSAPEDIMMACVLLTQWLHKMRNSDLALTAPIIDTRAGVTIMPIQLPSIVTTILDDYVRIIVKAV